MLTILEFQYCTSIVPVLLGLTILEQYWYNTGFPVSLQILEFPVLCAYRYWIFQYCRFDNTGASSIVRLRYWKIQYCGMDDTGSTSIVDDTGILVLYQYCPVLLCSTILEQYWYNTGFPVSLQILEFPVLCAYRFPVLCAYRYWIFQYCIFDITGASSIVRLRYWKASIVQYRPIQDSSNVHLQYWKFQFLVSILFFKNSFVYQSKVFNQKQFYITFVSVLFVCVWVCVGVCE